jgi:hypothetical protein
MGCLNGSSARNQTHDSQVRLSTQRAALLLRGVAESSDWI